MEIDLFPDLEEEREHLELARRCRLRMIERYQAILRGDLAADEVTGEYVEATLSQALDGLAPEDAADFFGRIDTEADETLRIGKRHIEDGRHEPVVIDWRAPAAAAFYRATARDPFGLRRRRRYTLRSGQLVAYNDEHLDDPEEADFVGGIPDPVLAELGLARTGVMRDIVATIQAEQDEVIRAPLDDALVVQGGPGAGKTAVGLHRVAYLLFEHRRRLERDGVLVVGPNRVFLDYVADVLPSLGERSVLQRTATELATPRLPVGGTEPDEVARLKGDSRWATVIERAAMARLSPPERTVQFGHGARFVTVTADDLLGWMIDALDGRAPLNRRRATFRQHVQREVARRTGSEGVALPRSVRSVLDRAWPTIDPAVLVRRLLTRPAELSAAASGVLDEAEQRLVRRSSRAPWTEADLFLVDEARALVEGVPATFGHVVVDEAQDLSPMALRMIARRCPTRSLTILGDLAQATAAGAPGSWTATLDAVGAASGRVANLSIGYRVPQPILQVAERLLPLAGVAVPTSRSVRTAEAHPKLVASRALWLDVLAQVDALRGEHALSGVIVPDHRRQEAVDNLTSYGRRPVARIDHLSPDDLPVLAATDAKGLELDGVVVADPRSFLAQGERGARLLYVAMTRAVQRLVVVADGDLPEPL